MPQLTFARRRRRVCLKLEAPQPAQLVASGVKFEIYHIRSVLHGGEALDELVVSKQGCKWVGQETVWSE